MSDSLEPLVQEQPGSNDRFRFLKIGSLLVLTIAAAGVAYLIMGRSSAETMPGESQADGREDHAKHQDNKARYHCPMHPTYTSDKPGECPICGMTLVPTEEEKVDTSSVSNRVKVSVTPERRQLIGVRLGTVEKKAFSMTIRAAGRVDYNERGISRVNQRFAGWVEDIFVSALGDFVEIGQPLFEIYSPELLEAQRSYILAFESSRALQNGSSPEASDFAEKTLASARERLLLWGITEEQIKTLEINKESGRRVKIHSKVRGVVTKKDIVLGSYVQPGVDLYEIADLSTVWITANIHEYEIPDVKAGLTVHAHLVSMPEEDITGKIIYIYPYLSEQTRSMTTRSEIPNPDGKLKPGMYATISIQVDLGDQVVVDDSAILDSGTRQIVFVDAGEGKFDPREVIVGARSDGKAVILKGLADGERVVLSGNFLIDAESRLKASLQQMSQPAEEHKH